MAAIPFLFSIGRILAALLAALKWTNKLLKAWGLWIGLAIPKINRFISTTLQWANLNKRLVVGVLTVGFITYTFTTMFSADSDIMKLFPAIHPGGGPQSGRNTMLTDWHRPMEMVKNFTYPTRILNYSVRIQLDFLNALCVEPTFTYWSYFNQYIPLSYTLVIGIGIYNAVIALGLAVQQIILISYILRFVRLILVITSFKLHPMFKPQ